MTEAKSEDEAYNPLARAASSSAAVWTPAHGARQVFVSVEVGMVSHVSTLSQSFEARFSVTQEWMLSEDEAHRLDEHLAGRLEKWEPDWTPPQPRIPGAIDVKYLKDGEVGVVSKGMRAENRMRLAMRELTVHAVFGETLELHSFPFDCQDLSVELRWPVSRKIQTVWPNTISTPDFVVVSEVARQSLSEWVMHPPVVEFSHRNVNMIDEHFNPVQVQQPAMMFRLKVERVWRAYVYQVGLVLCLISLGVLGSFTIEVESTGDRLSQAVTMLLTCIAFQFVVNSMLPKISYLTLADLYLLSCNCFIASVLVQIALEALLLTHFDVNITNDADTWVLFVNFLLWAFIQAGFAGWIIFHALPTERNKLVKSTADLRYIECTADALQVDGDVVARLPSPTDPTGEQFVYHGSQEQRAAAGISLEKKPTGLFHGDLGKGVEHFRASAEFTGHAEELLIHKVTGDDDVPAGKLFVVCKRIPKLGKPVEGKIRVRDSSTASGFAWDTSARITLEDGGVLSVQGSQQQFELQQISQQQVQSK